MSNEPELSQVDDEKEPKVFLSYSSQQIELAVTLRDLLRAAGIECWVAARDVGGGEPYTTKIVQAIRDCRLFLVLLTESASRSAHVMKEFDRAIAYSKPILPLKIGAFPANESMEYFLSHVQWVEFPETVGKADSARMVELVKQRLEGVEATMTSWPAREGGSKQTWAARQWALGLLGLLVLVPVLWLATYAWRPSPVPKPNPPSAYPRTQAEKNALAEMLTYLQQELTSLNGILTSHEQVLDIANTFLTDPTEARYQEFASRCRHEANQVDESLQYNRPLPDGLRSRLADSPINIGDLSALEEVVRTQAKEVRDDLEYMLFLLDPKNRLDIPTKRRWLEVSRQLRALSVRTLHYSTCELLLPVDVSAVEKFRLEVIPLITSFSDDRPWLRDPVEIKQRLESSWTKQNQLVMELSSLVGEINVAVQAKTAPSAKPAHTKDRKADAADPTASERVEQKKQDLERLTQELAEKQQQLDEGHERIRKKFAPLATDEPGLLWGKAMRFLSVSLYDDAVRAFQMYQEKVAKDDSNAAVYVPAAIRFVRSIGTTGVDYGAIVMAYEPGKPPHPTLRIGDVIIAIDGTPTINSDQALAMLAEAVNDPVVTVLRADSEGKLVRQEAVAVRGATKVGLLSLSERKE